MNGPRLLKSYLKAKKISLRELARRADIDPAALCRARQGKRSLGLVAAFKVQAATDGEVPAQEWAA